MGVRAVPVLAERRPPGRDGRDGLCPRYQRDPGNTLAMCSPDGPRRKQAPRGRRFRTLSRRTRRSSPPPTRTGGERSAMTTPAVTRRIDVDTHFYPPVDYKALREYLPHGLLAQARDMLVRDAMRATEPDRVAAETRGVTPSSRHGSDPHRNPNARATAMAQTGFDMQVLIPDGLFANLYGASPSGGDLSLLIRTALCQLYNDAVADAQRRYPERFIGAATIPFDDLEASILEARRAVQELGLRAVLVPGNWLGNNFDALELYPFWGALHELDVTVFVHHIP